MNHYTCVCMCMCVCVCVCVPCIVHSDRTRNVTWIIINVCVCMRACDMHHSHWLYMCVWYKSLYMSVCACVYVFSIRDMNHSYWASARASWLRICMWHESFDCTYVCDMHHSYWGAVTYVCDMRVIHSDSTWNVQPIADRVAQHLEIISITFPTNQNSAHGIYD